MVLVFKNTKYERNTSRIKKRFKKVLHHGPDKTCSDLDHVDSDLDHGLVQSLIDPLIEDMFSQIDG